jgi:hypothetical protein
MISAAIAFASCWCYAARRRRLIAEEVDQALVRGMTHSVIPGVPINAAATLVALWSPHTALALFAAMALFYVVGSSVFSREPSPSPEGSPPHGGPALPHGPTPLPEGERPRSPGTSTT